MTKIHYLTTRRTTVEVRPPRRHKQAPAGTFDIIAADNGMALIDACVPEAFAKAVLALWKTQKA